MKTALKWGTQSSVWPGCPDGHSGGPGPWKKDRRWSGYLGAPSSGEVVGSGKVSLKDLGKERETSRGGEKAAGGQEAGTLQGQSTEVGHNGRPSWLERWDGRGADRTGLFAERSKFLTIWGPWTKESSQVTRDEKKTELDAGARKSWAMVVVTKQRPRLKRWKSQWVLESFPKGLMWVRKKDVEAQQGFPALARHLRKTGQVSFVWPQSHHSPLLSSVPENFWLKALENFLSLPLLVLRLTYGAQEIQQVRSRWPHSPLLSPHREKTVPSLPKNKRGP